MVWEPPSKWYWLSRVNSRSLSSLHVNTRNERSWDAVTTRKLSYASNMKTQIHHRHGTLSGIQLRPGELVFLWTSNDKPTKDMAEMGIVWSLKFSSRTPFSVYTHSCSPAANTMQLLFLASRRICEDRVFSVKGKDSTCWTKMDFKKVQINHSAFKSVFSMWIKTAVTFVVRITKYTLNITELKWVRIKLWLSFLSLNSFELVL